MRRRQSSRDNQRKADWRRQSQLGSYEHYGRGGIDFLSQSFKDRIAVGVTDMKFETITTESISTADSSLTVIENHSCNDDERSLITPSSETGLSHCGVVVNPQTLYVKQSPCCLSQRVELEGNQDRTPAIYLNENSVNQGDSRLQTEAVLHTLINEAEGRRSVRRGTLKFWKVRRGAMQIIKMLHKEQVSTCIRHAICNQEVTLECI